MVNSFEVGSRYRHMSCYDIDFDVVVKYDVEEEDGGVVVFTFWNRHYKTHQGNAMRAQVKKEDFWKWQKIKDLT